MKMISNKLRNKVFEIDIPIGFEDITVGELFEVCNLIGAYAAVDGDRQTITFKEVGDASGTECEC